MRKINNVWTAIKLSDVSLDGLCGQHLAHHKERLLFRMVHLATIGTKRSNLWAILTIGESSTAVRIYPGLLFEVWRLRRRKQHKGRLASLAKTSLVRRGRDPLV